MKNILLCLALTVSAVGCGSVRLTDASVRPVVLHEGQRLKQASGIGKHISLPAGTYEPNFETDDGIYYRTSKNIIEHTMVGDFIGRGGLFLPHSNAKDRRHGAWFDNQNTSSAIGIAATSPKRIYRLKESVTYEFLPVVNQAVP